MAAEEPVQKIHSKVKFSIEHHNTEVVSEDARRGGGFFYRLPAPRGPWPPEAIIKQFIRPFDLSQAPLLRVGVIRESEKRHILVVDMHHIISDGFSMNIIVDEFSTLYAGGKLPALRVRYRDYVLWQGSREQQAAVKRQEAFWVREFSGETPVLDLPFDFPRPPVQSFEGDTVVFRLGREETLALNRWAKDRDATLFMVLLAVYNILLSKLSGQEDIIVGTPIVGRRHADFQQVIGMFVNTLVLRNFPGLGKTFDRFLQEIKERTLEAFENQEYQFEDLVEKVDVRRDAARNPLFDVMFSFQNLAEQTGNRPETDTGGDENRISKFDLTLNAVEAGERLHFGFEYAVKLFKKETIERFADYFKRIVFSIVQHPGRKIAEIGIISKEEKRRILEEFNNTAASYPKEKTLVRVFEEQVKKTPDNAAVTIPAASITYGQLDRMSDQLAHLLRAKGVQPDTIAALMVERSVEMMVGIFGILKAGGAYLPIEPNYPAERINYILSDSNTALLLTTREVSEGLTSGKEMIYLEDYKEKEGIHHSSFFAHHSENLAYVIYTSGSTGKPKGTMIQHYSVINRLNWMQRYYPLDERDVILQKTTYVFDVSVWELFWWSFNGASVSLLGPGEEKDPAAIVKAVEESKVTTMHFVPSMLTAFLDYVEEAGESKRLTSLRQVFASGEALGVEQVERFNKLLSKNGTRLINLYGPTEATVDVSYFNCPTEGVVEKVPIGKPIDNTQLYVLGEAGQFQPVGIAGELCIAGDQLARGYLNRPELTTEKFCLRRPGALFKKTAPGPRKNFLFEPYSLIYKTGDLARWLDDGNIEFLGRIDYQVKIRGFRVELGEIEAQLRKEKEIKEVVVIDRTDNTGSKYLCAYIVPAAEIHLPVLRDRLSSCLPEYMVPAHFMALDKIPLTPNGKLDRKALPVPEIIAETAYTAPRDDVEKTLQNIWAEVLNVENEQLGIDANFFRVGGHSLKATTLVSRIHKELDVKVPLAEIFKKSTIRSFAQYIKEAAENKYASITPAEPRAYYPLSSAQKRLYILQQIEKESIGYNMPQVIRLSLDIDGQKIAHILETLIQRHESLRTSFEMQDGKPVQKVHATVPFELVIYKTGEEQAGKIIAGFIIPFDLAAAPLLRVGMIKTGEMEHIFMMDMHHIITDGVSQEIFIREFMALYSGEELPPLRLQYKDYSEWQNSAEFKAMIKQQEAYWLKEYPGEIPLLDLPADFARPVVQSFDGRFEHFSLESRETAKLKQLARQLDGTLYMVLLALFNVFLSKLGRNEDVIVGTPVAARRHADLEQVLGMFVNTLALRNFPTGEKTFKAFVAEVKERALQVFENQEYQFEELVEKVVYRRDTSRNPLFDVFFVLQTQAETTREGLESRLAEEVENRISKFDLTLNAVEAGERLHLGFEYVSKLFKKETIERFINYFKRILSFVIDHPEKKIADIAIISGEEKKRILEEFNNTDAPYPGEKTLSRVFEEQAAQTPDSIALVGPASITYKQLNLMADQLAGLLRSKGVGPDTIAALMVERSVEMMEGIFGILKAGGAYLPIDPNYPKERINYILSDSSAALLLTTREVSEGLTSDKEMIYLEDYKEKEGIHHSSFITHHSENLAYVIYTSGSTGKPKGTMIRHYSVINRLNWMQRYYPLDERDVILQKTTYTFDVSVWELFWWSFNGASLRLLGPGEEKDPGAIVEAVEESKVTTMHFVPSMLTAFLDYVENTNESERLASLRQVFASGEALGVSQVERFNKLLSKNGTRLINLYGPTEATVDVSYFNCPTEGVVEKVPIGKPIDNTQLYVLGEAGQLQPVGIAGELCIGGDQLARGYLNRPELTKQKFCGGPGGGFSKEPPGRRRLYKTGDLARWLDDGNIEFLGRIDYQVKIRGFRIEPGEIESHLMAHEEIKTVVVVVLQRQSDPNKQALCAYFTAQKQLDVSELRGYLTGKVPAYMIPAYFMQVEEIPLSVNGKLDRRRLPSPEIKTGTEYIAPKSHTEKTIADIWKQVLGLEKVGTLDNFFEIGGNSLDIIQVNSQLNESLNKNIPVVTMFRYPTIRSLVDYLENENISGTISHEKIDQSRDKMEKTIGIMKKMQQNRN
jgi:tyrocidine synthetase-3